MGSSGFLAAIPDPPPFERERLWGDGVGVGVVSEAVGKATGGTKGMPAAVKGLGMSPA